jgi:hypothetical protein
VFEMCNISEGIEERGIRQGIRQTKCENIKSVMESLDVSVERAMDILGISEDDRDEYIKMLA